MRVSQVRDQEAGILRKERETLSHESLRIRGIFEEIQGVFSQKSRKEEAKDPQLSSRHDEL